ncbi:DinB family protein [Plantactinospora sonchi]|uniref:DinB family protein n=1 Tax=Plantactinospora sonchi TaxID=1544735 RepID=A0ABU7RR99_9ACTN
MSSGETTITDGTTVAGQRTVADRSAVTGERADLLESLARHRFFLRHTVQGLTDEQAARRTTVSALCLGGLIKHVAGTEREWADFIVDGPSVMPAWNDPATYEEHANDFTMLPGETLAGYLAHYEEVARHTDELVRTLPDLDAAHPLPEAPWFEPGATWSARRVLLHIIAETAQHAGHADILREALDGQKTMG